MQTQGKPLPSELKRLSIRGIVWAASESIGVAAISMVSFIILARLLQPQDFGIVALATVFVFFCNLVTAHGFSDALVQRHHIETGHLDTAFWSTVGLSVLLMVVCMIGAGPISNLLGEPRLAEVLRWLSVSLPIGAVSTVHMAIFRRDMRFDAVARRSLFGRTVGAAAGVAAAYYGFGLWSLVAQQLIGQLATSLAFATTRWRPRWYFSRTCFRDMWGFGFHVSASQIIAGAGEQVLTLMIGTMFGTAALGYFTVAWRAIQIIKSLVSSAVYHVGLSAFSKLQKDQTALTHAFLNATRISSLIGFPLGIGIFVIANPLVHVAFDAKWLPSVPLLALLALELMPAFFGMFLSALYRSSNKAAWSLLMAIAYTLTGFLGVMIAAPYGVETAVGVWIARSLFLAPVHVFLVSRLLSLPIGQVARPAAAPCLAAIAMGIGGATLQSSLPLDFSSALVLAIVIPASAAIYVGMIYALNPSLAELAVRTSAVLFPGRQIAKTRL